MLQFLLRIEVTFMLIFTLAVGVMSTIGGTLPYDGEIRYFLQTTNGLVPYAMDALHGLAFQMRDTLPASSAAWSSDNQHIIAYFGNATYVTNLRGDELHHLSGNRVFPVWSADGTHIAFETFINTFGRVYVANGDGTDVVAIIPDERMDYSQPRFSPDGTHLAFIGGADLYVMTLADGTITRLTQTDEQIEVEPVWSPDSQRIAFLWHLMSTNNQLSIIDADGQNRRDLTNTPSVLVIEPRWSPNSTHISYMANTAEGYTVFILDISSGEPRQLDVTYPFTTTDAQASWSTDGRQIQVNWTNIDVNGINVSDDTIDVTTRELLSRESAVRFPAASPDGSAYIGYGYSGICLMNALDEQSVIRCHDTHVGLPTSFVWLP